jgi:hypothetical protein
MPPKAPQEADLGCLILIIVSVVSYLLAAATGNYDVLALLFLGLLAYLFFGMLAWVGDASGLGEGGKAKALLHDRGYSWVTLSQAQTLAKKCGWRYEWIKKLPPRDEVALTAIYQGDSVDSLIACAKILLPRQRDSERRARMAASAGAPQDNSTEA